MTGNWLRRAMLGAACAAATLLAACGSSTIESALKPARLVVFGDAMADVGFSGARYTVNDTTVKTWVEQLATHYGLAMSTAAAGGQNYARGNARVQAKPDAAGNASTLTVKEQVDAFLAAGTVGANDVIILNAGVSDVVAEINAAVSGAQTEAQAIAKIEQAGRDLGEQVRRMTVAGAMHVVVMGTYNLGRSPWATSMNKVSLLQTASARFNEELLVAIVDLGAKVLYVDAAYYLNLVVSSPEAYSMSNATNIACNSVDAGNGIGIGTGQVNSLLCTTGTITAGLDYNKQVFADRLYFTPPAYRVLGTYAFDKIRDRW